MCTLWVPGNAGQALTAVRRTHHRPRKAMASPPTPAPCAERTPTDAHSCVQVRVLSGSGSCSMMRSRPHTSSAPCSIARVTPCKSRRRLNSGCCAQCSRGRARQARCRRLLVPRRLGLAASLCIRIALARLGRLLGGRRLCRAAAAPLDCTRQPPASALQVQINLHLLKVSTPQGVSK